MTRRILFWRVVLALYILACLAFVIYLWDNTSEHPWWGKHDEEQMDKSDLEGH